MSMFEDMTTVPAYERPIVDLEDPSIGGAFIKRQQQEQAAAQQQQQQQQSQLDPKQKQKQEAQTPPPSSSSTTSQQPYRFLSPEDTLTRKESTAVVRLRSLVFLILFLTAVAVSAALFWITRQGESSEFETQYDGAATKVLESFADIVYEMGAISGLGVASSAHSVDHKSDWPFVTLSNFQQRYVLVLL